MPEKSELLSTRQAAKLLGLCENTLVLWRRAHQHLPFIRVGRGFVRYRRADVEAVLREGTVAPNPADCPQTPDKQTDDPARDAEPQSIQTGDKP